MMKKRRVLLKISGEALMGRFEHGIDADYLNELTLEIKAIREKGVEIILVLGGGNIFRGVEGISTGITPVASHYMGMLAVHINGIAVVDIFRKNGQKALLFSPFDIQNVAERLNKQFEIESLEAGTILVFAGGTGAPYFTTDTGGVLRALELNCDSFIKATQVDGLYDKDPKKYKDAKFIENATYDYAISENLRVMDTSAFVLAKENNLEIRIVSLKKKGAILRACLGEKEGTIIKN